MNSRICLVTGGAGFIGSHIAQALLRRGDKVRVFDNLSTGKRKNLEAIPGAEFVEGDLRDLGAIRQATRGVQVVFHQAALPSVARSLEDPATSEQCNTLGTVHALMAAKEAKVEKFLYAGSSSAYGKATQFPVREEFPVDPLSPYAASKAAGEQFCRAFAESFGLPTVVLRYFNVFGPRQDALSPYTGVIALFVRALLEGKSPTIFGDGAQSRDFTYVENVVAGNLLAAERTLPPGEVINLALGSETTVNDLFAAIAKEMGSSLRPQYGPVRAGDVRRSVAGVEKAKRMLGFSPVVSFEEGIKRTVAWYRETGNR